MVSFSLFITQLSLWNSSFCWKLLALFYHICRQPLQPIPWSTFISVKLSRMKYLLLVLLISRYKMHGRYESFAKLGQVQQRGTDQQKGWINALTFMFYVLCYIGAFKPSTTTVFINIFNHEVISQDNIILSKSITVIPNQSSIVKKAKNFFFMFLIYIHLSLHSTIFKLYYLVFLAISKRMYFIL